MLATFFLSLLVGFSGAAIPGPLLALTIEQALLVGWMAGVWLMVGHMLAEGALFIALRYGVGRFLVQPRVVRVVGALGGAFMLWMAWDMLSAAWHGPPSVSAAHTGALSVLALVGKGFTLSVLNPTWHIWWATVGVALIAAQVEKGGPRAWLAFYFGHTSADYLWYVLVALLVAVGGTVVPPAVHRGIILGCGAFIAVVGLLFIARPLLERLTPRR